MNQSQEQRHHFDLHLLGGGGVAHGPSRRHRGHRRLHRLPGEQDGEQHGLIDAWYCLEGLLYHHVHTKFCQNGLGSLCHYQGGKEFQPPLQNHLSAGQLEQNTWRLPELRSNHQYLSLYLQDYFSSYFLTSCFCSKGVQLNQTRSWPDGRSIIDQTNLWHYATSGL